MSDIFHTGKSEAGTYTEWRVHGVPSEGDEPYLSRRTVTITEWDSAP